MTYYFSVESRKGGVGKTTVALNLGRCLLQAGYRVLLLDCDITGTSIAQCCENSVFWEKCVNVIKHEEEKEKIPVNLLDYFRNKFLMGEEDDWNKKGNSTYELDKINVIGSELYDKGKLVIDPRELMDELHSYWVVTMLQDIVANFRENRHEKAAVIIDNSPGYAGMGRAIHEWMTDIGPKYAKFILVSSLDEQDIQSTVSSMKEIQRIMEGKARVNRYYQNLKDSGKNAMLDKKEEQFLKSDSCFDRFFYKLTNGANYEIDATNNTLQNYVALILNKVGDDLKDEDYSYDFEGLLSDDYFTLKSLWGNQEKGYKKNMIAFDENIQSQFFSRRLNYVKEGTGKYWKGRFEKLRSDVDSLRGMQDVLNASFKLDNYLRTLKTSMTQKGRAKLSADIGQQWCFRRASEKLIKCITDIAYYNKPDNILDLSKVNKVDLLEFNKLRLQQHVEKMHLDNFEPELRTVFEYVYNLAGAGKNKRDVRLLATVSVFINTFMCMHEHIFSGNDFRKFLISECRRDVAPTSVDLYVGKYVPITKDVVLNTDFFLGVSGKCFVPFYHSLCNTLIRVKDRFDNFMLLADTFEKIIATSYLKVIPAEVKKHLDNMIIYQTEDHSMKDINKVILDTIRMHEFEEVIDQIRTKTWNL